MTLIGESVINYL